MKHYQEKKNVFAIEIRLDFFFINNLYWRNRLYSLKIINVHEIPFDFGDWYVIEFRTRPDLGILVRIRTRYFGNAGIFCEGSNPDRAQS